MEQSYLPLADFFPSEQSCWCPAIVHKKLELGHLIGDRRVTGILRGDNILKQNAYNTNCYKLLKKN